MAAWRVAVLGVALLAAVVRGESECCSTCIGKTSSTPYTYDPVVYNQCTSVTDGICCFDCGNLGEPSYGDTVSYASDGTTAVVKQGSYLSFTWSDVVNVTYISLKPNQKKITTPSISDAKAEKKSNTFLICAKSPGVIYFRGWGSDTCREASTEKSVTVEASDKSDGTCDANDVKVPNPQSGSSDASASASSSSSAITKAECNLNRASWTAVDGVDTCVCVSDWSNPPACDQWPVWKWLVTIGGGVAAFFSIIISVRAFLKSREKKQHDEDDRANTSATLVPAGETKSEMETLQITPDRRHDSDALGPFTQDSERGPGATNAAARKQDEREFTL